MFLGDGLLQNLTEWTGNSIPSLGDVTFTDGVTPVVYFNQLDERYASQPYGTDNIGGYGCGPTAMSIVVSSLTDETVDPVAMAQWSYENGYWCKNSGSYHALIPAAAIRLYDFRAPADIGCPRRWKAGRGDHVRRSLYFVRAFYRSPWCERRSDYGGGPGQL